MLESLFLGSSGYYQVLGTTVRFTEKPHKDSYFGSLDEGRLVTQFAIRCMGSRVLRILSLGYVHVLVHEVSHAAMYRIVTGRATSVKIHTKSCEGTTSYKKRLRKSPKWQRTAVDLAGPVGDIAFCITKLVLANFLIKGGSCDQSPIS